MIAPSLAAAERQALLVNSYRQNMTWVEQVTGAVRKRLHQAGVQLQIENMDAKRFHSERYLQSLRRHLAEKFRDRRFDILLASDNYAFEFLQRYRDELFPGVPLLFTGVNDFKPEMLNGRRDVTGVAEVFEARATLELALQLHPATRRVLVINDYLKTGRAWQQDMQRQLQPLQDRVEILYSDNLSLNELQQRLRSLPADSLVLLGVYFSDRDGLTLSYEEMGRRIAKASPVPVYALLDFNVGPGVVGGKVISGEGQGEAMVEMALRVLAGESPADIPVVRQSSNRYLFQVPELIRWGIDEERLPANSFFINRPFSFYQAYRVQIQLAGLLIALMLAVIVALIFNVRKRVRLEQALQQSRRNLSVMFDNSVQLIGLLTPDGRLIEANQTSLNFAGVSPEEVLGRLFVDTPWWEHSSEQRELLRKAIDKAASGECASFAASHTDNEGVLHQIDFSLKPIFNERNEVVFLVPEGRDVTELKQAESQLQWLRHYLQNIIGSMPSVLVAVDSAGVVQLWNRAAEQRTGIAASQARGKELERVFPELAEESERIAQALAEARVITRRRVERRVRGELRYEDITIYPLLGEALDGAVLRLDDVTEQRQIEEMMLQSEKMLSVGGLAAGMAHEINNPLAGILQNAQVLRQRLDLSRERNQQAADEAGLDSDAFERYLRARQVWQLLEAILESGKRASSIVQNMLSFSRKSEGQLRRQPLPPLIDKAVALAQNDYDLKKRYDFRRIQIVREFADGLPAVPCDANQIQQLLFNLLKNAAQAMAGGDKAPQIVIRLKRFGNSVRLEVEDNGPGMEEAVRRRVFEPFFTTKDVGQGTGLGLSVSFFIVTESHGGNMSVVSEPGKGCCFVIDLPIEQTSAKDIPGSGR